jgi:hypothetical protein
MQLSESRIQSVQRHIEQPFFASLLYMMLGEVVPKRLRYSTMPLAVADMQTDVRKTQMILKPMI